MSRIVFYLTRTSDVLPIDKPLLLWDCHCGIRESKFSKEDCPIHSNPIHKEIIRAFGSGLVRIDWRGLSFYWKDKIDLWPPSADTFFMVGLLEKQGLFSDKVNSVADFGSGTGFFGITIGSFNQSVKKVMLSDWLLTPYFFGIGNYFANRRFHQDSFSLSPALGLGTKAIFGHDAQGKYDVAVCNPPYLPILDGFEDLAREQTVAGTDLLDDVLANSKKLAKRVYINCSDIAYAELEASRLRHDVNLKPLGEKLVPFRVRPALDRDGYVEALMSDERRSLAYCPDHRYPYWHTIRVYEIEN